MWLRVRLHLGDAISEVALIDSAGVLVCIRSPNTVPMGQTEAIYLVIRNTKTHLAK